MPAKIGETGIDAHTGAGTNQQSVCITDDFSGVVDDLSEVRDCTRHSVGLSFMVRFHFKQFSVAHDRASMKVGTDAILIGAWAATAATPARILDVGTGCGIIALMMAQRFPSAEVVGIDLHQASVLEAESNFQNSRWADRMLARHTALQDYSTDRAFDLIVSNPPWFRNSLKPPDGVRDAARHDDRLSAEDLLDSCDRLLSTDGTLCCIVPIEHEELLCSAAIARGLSLHQKCRVRPRPELEPHRIMLALVRGESRLCDTELAIEVKRHVPTSEYGMLTVEFLLKH